MGKRVKKVEKMIKDFKRTQTQIKNKYNLDNKKGNNQPADDKKKDIMYGILMDQISKIDTELSDIGSKIKKEEQALSKISPDEQDEIQQEVKEKHKKSLKKLKDEQERKVEEKKELKKQLRENKTKKEMKDEIDKITSEISVIDLRIKEYQEKLAKTSPSEKELVAEYLKNIQELEEQKNSQEMLAKQEEKAKLEGQIKRKEKLEREEIEKELKDQEEEIRPKLAKEKREIEEDIRNIELQRDKVDANIRSLIRQMKDFEYKYEEQKYEVIEKDENGNKVIKQKTSRRIANTEEYEKLNADYQKSLDAFMSLKETLEDLQEAKELCEQEMDKFRQKDQERMEKFSKALNDAKRIEEQEKENKGPTKKEPEEKEETEKKGLTKNESKRKEEQGTDKDESTKDEKRQDKKEENESEEKKSEWHPELIQEQIDELKAEGIEPGEQEYDIYLRNHGINTKQEKKEAETKKSKWHPELTQEQIDDLKAEGIEPGDQEYNMYLRNHGIAIKPEEKKPEEKKPEEKKPEEKKPEEKKPEEKKNWDSQLTQEQINELKAEGIKPGDQEYNLYLRNYGIRPCSIRIGRSGTITYNGKIYNVSKEDIREAIKVSSYSDRNLKRYIKKELGMSKEVTKYLMGFVKDGYLDMTVVHAIYSTDLGDAQKKEILDRQINKIDKFKMGQKYQVNEINIEYDMDDLSKANSLWDRIRGKEVNGKQKLKLCENARIAERWGLGKVKGEYNPPEKAKTIRERFLSFLDRKQIKKLPVHDKEDLHLIAREYHELAYDKEGNKLKKRQVKSKYNKFKDDLKVDTKQGLKELEELIDAHTNPEKVKKAHKKQDKEVNDDDGSR